MTSREQFEAEYSKMIGTPIGVLKVLRAGDVYTETDGDRLSIAWWAWQASREAVDIKLPEVCAFNLCELLDKKQVIEAIRAAGIKVKGE